MSCPPKILLVDDREENLTALQGILDLEEAEILGARSGRRALDLLLEYQSIALAIIDVRMPEMDGFELAELMRGSERTREIPIIFVTAGMPDQAPVFKGYESGAIDFLTKPIDERILRSKVEVFMQLYQQKLQLARRVRELESALRERRRAEATLREAVRSRDQFLSVASHELRTPLTALSLQLESLQRLLASGCSRDPGRASRKLETAARQSDRLAVLVEGLLSVSRLAAGRLHLQPEAFDLRDCIEDVTDRLTEMALRAGCELRLFFRGSGRGTWDRSRLDQVLMNLLTNAIKYGRNAPIDVILEGKDDIVRLEVRDRGIGIAQDDQPRIFGRFERAVSSRHHGGLGLGLYISREIIQAHGGNIEVSSKPGEGSTFVVSLPRNSEAIDDYPMTGEEVRA